MQSLIIFCFAALVACAHAKVHSRPRPPGYVVGHKDAAYYYPRPHHLDRHTRDTPWEHNAGRGKVFGTLGGTDDSGRGGFRQDIFKERGRLQGVVYGKRVLVAGGDSSVLGSKFNWHNANDNMKLTGDDVWNLDHNTRFVAGGNLVKQFGHHRPGVGIQGAFEHDF